MKLLLKLLLALFILIAAIYAAIPLWLPYVFASQLPPGWQLEKLEASYPGFSGINISTLRVKGDLQAAGLALTAADIRFTYQGLKTDIGSFSLDVFMLAEEDKAAGALTLDDLSLPITKLTGELPALSISQLRIALHSVVGIKPGTTGASQPLVLNFQALKLLPGTDNNFYVTTIASIEDIPGVNGQLDVDVRSNSRKAELRFPASVNSPPWLAISLEQTDQVQNTTTQIQAIFDAEQANREWLDKILMQGTGGLLTHVTGKLEVQADFTGDEMQDIENLSFTTEQLQAEIESGVLVLDAELLAHREGEKITVTLPDPADIRYQDKAGKINDLLLSAIPELQRTSQPLSMAHALLETSSSFVIQAGPDPSMTFTGDIKLDLSSIESSIHLQTTDIQIEIEDFSRPDSTTAQGLVTLNWEENAPFAYASDDLELQADKLSLASTGQLQVANQTVDFKQVGDFEIQLKDLRSKLQTGTPEDPAWLELVSDHYAMQGRLDFDLSMSGPETPVNFYFEGPVTASHPVTQIPGDEHSPSITVEASEMSIAAELTSRDGSLVSTGGGTFMHGHVAPLATSATKTDITWQDLDLINMAGKFGTKTQGFVTELEGETWKGFNFDITYTLLSNADVDGSGTLKFDSGLDMPIEFSGNAEAEHWNIKLPTTTIKLSQLGSLLRVAHFELPETVELTDGYIDIQGDIVVEDEISAKITVQGHEMAASMLESSAHKASFAFDTSYGSTISASGPVSIETIALAGGVDVRNIGTDLNLENMDTFGLKNLRAEVFDGRLSLGNLRFSENRIEDTTIELSHINLGRLLAFADIDGLEGTGFLDISLPVGSDQIGVYIKNGTFSSNGPGRLAYTKEGVAGSNIGLQALENFQYQDLSGTINYQSGGAYQIVIRLEGKNPDLYGGHPVVFNLTIGGSLPEFFEAMFMTGSFEESILKQIRTK